MRWAERGGGATRARSIIIQLLVMAGGALSGAPVLAAPPTLEAIVETRSIDSLTLSRDGRRLAYRVASPSLADNRTTVRWYAIDVTRGTKPVALGVPSEPLYLPAYDLVADGQAVWDGSARLLYVLQPGEDGVQIHALGPHGQDRRLTREGSDIVSLVLAPDGRRLRYKVHNSREVIARRQARETREGIHFDRTIMSEGLRLTANFRIGSRMTTLRWTGPSQAGEAFAGAEQDREIRIATRGGKQTHAARNEAPQPYLNLAAGGALPAMLRNPKTGIELRVERVPTAGKVLGNLVQLVAMLPDRTLRRCEAFFCSGLSDLVREVSFDDASGDVVILYEADYSARTGVYAWNPVTGTTRQILAPAASLDGGSGYSASVCPKVAGALLCVRAGPTEPPALVRIDLSTGATESLAEPNAVLARQSFTPARFVEWTDSEGRRANGVLMLPARQSEPLPLVITTYRCRGFLRGGTGWLAAEHILVQMGFATLCANNNNANILMPQAEHPDIPFDGLRQTVSAYEAIIDRLAREGVIDRTKVGIAGHSFSANVVAYAISHTKLFAAAVIGSGITVDPATSFLIAAPRDSWRRGVFDFFNLPDPLVDPQRLWATASPALNAAKIDTALLMQPPEVEHQLDLQLFNAMETAGKPVDMFIYPDEGHIASRQPLHQYWRNRRSLDWFAFWLQARENRGADAAAPFDHWRALRQRRSGGSQ